MRRIVVLGGRGVFGSAVAEALRERGLEPVLPSRPEVDAESAAGLSAWLLPGDIVIDAAGPFQARTTALLEAATRVRADVIDLSDSLDYALAVRGWEGRFRRAGIRVFNSCSAVSAVTAAAIRRYGPEQPVRVSVCLVPASRESPSRGTAASLLASVGSPVRVLKEGRLAVQTGWRSSRVFRLPPGLGEVRGYLTESADAVTLPRVWPSLRQVDFWVDAHVPGANAVLAHAPARILAAGRGRRWLAAASAGLARIAGFPGGGYAVEVEGPAATVGALAMYAPCRSFLIAVLPAVLAAGALAGGPGPPPGLVPPDRHCQPEELFDELRRVGIEVESS